MTKHSAAVHDQEGPQGPSRSKRQATVVSIKKDTKTKTVAIAEPPLLNSPSSGDVEVRITERAYELYHRRGGHHGQDLDDWLTAEREVLSEESR